METLDVEICVGTPCHLMGAEDLIELTRELPERYQKNFNFKSSHCIENECQKAPVVRIDGKVYAKMTPEKLKATLKKYLSKKRWGSDD